VWQPATLVQVQTALNEEKIHLLAESSQVAPDVTLTASVPVATVIANPLPPEPPPTLNIPAPVVAKSNDVACMEWSDFSGTELKLATAALSDMKLGGSFETRQVEQVIRYWVYIPPLNNKAAINKKVAELKERGVEEYFIVQKTGPWRNAISLGVFKSQEAAQNFLNILRAKDVRSARVGERTGKQKATIFMLSGVDSAMEARLISLQREFPGSELKNVPCKH
jgi:hypothetical protein